MKNKLLLLTFSVLMIGCIKQVKSIGVDEILTIDIFEKYEDNLRMSTDMVNLNWDQIFTSKIRNYNRVDSKGIKFFVNTQPEKNKIILQLRYPNVNKPKNLDEVRKVVVEQIETLKKLYSKNKKFILEATSLSEKYIEYLNNNQPNEVYNNFTEKVKEQLTIEQFLNFNKQLINMGVSKNSRTYHGRLLFKLTGNESEYVNFIEIHYAHNSMPKNLESVNFEIIDDSEVKLVGYRVY